MRLKDLAETLKKSQTLSAEAQNQSRLRKILDECDAVSKELLRNLHQLKAPENTTHRKWKSFRQALKSVWSKAEVDRMAGRLANPRSELDTEVLVPVG